jgi:DNA polymerase-3 subunit epsilon
MTLIAGVDFETTGLDTANDRIIEIGACLWHVEQKRPVDMINWLVKPDGAVVSAEITRITGITQDDVETFGLPPVLALGTLVALLEKAEYVVAHNGKAFDKPILEAEIIRAAEPRYMDFPAKIKWIDSDSDVPYPDSIQTRKLKYLACEHDFLNPFSHRALFDVLTMLRVVSHYDFKEIAALAAEPDVTLRILTPAPWEDGGAGNKKARECGFRYHGETKSWRKTTKQSRIEKETSAALPFKVKIVEGSAAKTM